MRPIVQTMIATNALRGPAIVHAFFPRTIVSGRNAVVEHRGLMQSLPSLLAAAEQ